MSNTRKHIDRFLHDKLRDHDLPVGEMDWDLLEKRRNKKPRRKLGFFVLLFLCSATLAWKRSRYSELPTSCPRMPPAPRRSCAASADGYRRSRRSRSGRAAEGERQQRNRRQQRPRQHRRLRRPRRPPEHTGPRLPLKSRALRQKAPRTTRQTHGRVDQSTSKKP